VFQGNDGDAIEGTFCVGHIYLSLIFVASAKNEMGR
jgi:hypothetical protein